MDTLFFLGQLLALGGLGYGAWRCFLLAGKYDADSLRADIAASPAAGRRGHSETLAHQRMIIDDEELHLIA
jgi:hypothetical protein